MDYRKINSHIVLLGIVIVVGLLAAIIVRLSMLENGADAGTANLTFLLILGVSAVIYLIIIATLSRYIIPWMMKLLSFLTGKPIPQEVPEPEQKQAAEEEGPASEIASPVSVQEEKLADNHNLARSINPAPSPAVDIEKIKQDADQQYIERLKAKIDLFRRYAHTVIGPHITSDELGRLDEYIGQYAKEELLPNDITPIRPVKLKNPDMFHFGWNMAHYFDKKKQDVAPWLQKVFAPLAELELSYIVGKLHDGQTKKYIIPNIDDIPKYLADQEG